MFSTDFIFRQKENLVDNQKCQAGFRFPLLLDLGTLLNIVLTIPIRDNDSFLWVTNISVWLSSMRMYWVASTKPCNNFQSVLVVMGFFHLVAKIIREPKSHMIPYKFKCSHWLKLQHSDWRSNY